MIVGLPAKRLLCIDVCLKAKEESEFDPFTISELFKKFYSNLANHLFQKLHAAARKFDIKVVQNYYNYMSELGHDKLNFQTVQSNTISSLLRACNVNKTVGIEDVSGKFLKNGTDMLAIPITKIRNLSIKLSHFPKGCISP